MDVYIKSELTLIDTKTGCDMAPDLMASDTNIEYEDGVAIMDTETFRWWHEVLANLDYAYCQLDEYLDGLDEPEEASEYILDHIAYADIEDIATMIFDAINTLETDG